MFGNLLKAAVATVLTPVALVVDVVSLPKTANDLTSGPFDNTEKMLNSIGDNITKALK